MLHCTAQLKNLWLRQLKRDWERANYFFFKSNLTLPQFDLLNSRLTLGKWVGSYKRTLLINVHLIKNYPWEYVLEVLYHEMAHQYVEEFLTITDELPHGDTFKKICLTHCFDPSASGDIEEWVKNKKSITKNLLHDPISNKIHKLLALAESPNQHEAQLAMARAQELLLKYNISLVQNKVPLTFIHKQIGEVGRKNPIKSLISTIITSFFFVKAIWVFGYNQKSNKEGRIFEIYGTPENVEMAEYVHDFLHTISEVLWKSYKKEKNISGNLHRRTFICGLLKGFYTKLERSAYNKNRSKKTGTILNKEKHITLKTDPRLNEFFKKRNPKIKSSRTSYTRSNNDIYNSGIQKGKTLVIHKGIKDRQSGKTYLIAVAK